MLVEEGAGLPVAIVAFPSSVAGMLRRRRESSFIFVNGQQAVVRQRFTLAHEYGHYCLGHRSVVDRTRDLFDMRTRDPREVQANQFAGEFLAPRQAVRNWMELQQGPIDLDLAVRLANYFGISAKSGRIRLEDAGIIGRTAAGKLDESINDQQHLGRVKELGLRLFQDSLSGIERDGDLPRVPQRMQHDARIAFRHGLLDIEQIAQRLGRDVADVEAEFADIAPLEDDVGL